MTRDAMPSTLTSRVTEGWPESGPDRSSAGRVSAAGPTLGAPTTGGPASVSTRVSRPAREATDSMGLDRLADGDEAEVAGLAVDL
ncbi:MAG: hypothetical protein MUE68_08945 [Bacteroidetes bacterium]|nr:hypothetical protein [Bacteroidota bacterium]